MAEVPKITLQEQAQQDSCTGVATAFTIVSGELKSLPRYSIVVINAIKLSSLVFVFILELGSWATLVKMTGPW